MKLSNKQIHTFQKKILDYYQQHSRESLPWRKKSRTPYQVLVSEIMLQQTQVDRVVEFFKRWMKEFPNIKALARAPQSRVLKYWKGLGYNSRALRLHQLAKEVVGIYNGRLPRTRTELEALPGIGPYTAGAVLVFAFGAKDEVFIETNIRRVFIHHFFSNSKKPITDHQIIDLIIQTLPDKSGQANNGVDLFTWYSALMDYGSTLPKILKHNPNKKSKHYTRQSKFTGSNRQIRGAVLEVLLREKKVSKLKLINQMKEVIGYVPQQQRFEKILKQLEKEGFIIKTKTTVRLK